MFNFFYRNTENGFFMAVANKRNNDEGVVAILLLLFCSSFLFFFKNLNLVFLVFEITTLTFLLLICLNSMYHVWNEDNELAFENVFIAIPLVCLLLLSYFYISNIPYNLISIVSEQNIGSLIFNNVLTDYGKNLSVDIFIASLLLLIVLSYNIYCVSKKILYRYILENQYSAYIFISINFLLLGLSLFSFLIGIFR